MTAIRRRAALKPSLEEFLVFHSPKVFLVALALLASSPSSAVAQNNTSSGTSWSSTWGFSSASDRSLRLQEAQAIRTAEQGADVTTVVNNYNDNRSNYQEVNAGDATLDSINFQIGDEIGQSTYSVGSMNTGSTEISVVGDGNLIDAVNSSETDGDTDASILSETLSMMESLEAGNGSDPFLNGVWE